jgi:hypothetical protein
MNKDITFELYLELLNREVLKLSTIEDLDKVLNFIYKIEKEKKFFKTEDKQAYLSFANGIRDFIKRAILSGHLPNIETLYLYNIFDGLKIEREALFDKQKPIILENYKNLSFQDNLAEKKISNELVFIFDILNADTKEGFKRYIKEIFLVDLDGINSNFNDFLSFMSNQFLDFISVDFMFDILEDCFKNFTNLTYKEQRTLCNWTLHCVYNVPAYFNSKEWKQLYPIWKEALYILIERGSTDIIVYFQFFIYHFMGNLFKVQDEWTDYHEEINKPCANYYKTLKNNLIAPKANPNGKKRIALLKDRITNNSVFKLEFSLFKTLMSSKEFTDKYELYIYSCNYFEKHVDNDEIIKLFNSIGVRTVSPAKMEITKGYYNNHYQKALMIREALIEDEIDILVSYMNGYGISSLIYATRSTPKQIFWSHGDYTFDSEGIDNRIIAYGNTEDIDFGEFSFKSFPINLPNEFLAPPVAEKYINQIRNRFVGKVILGTICRFIKISDEFLEVLAKILKANPNAVYLACGDGDKQLLLNKVKAFGIEEQFVIEGFVDPHIYGYAFDIFLDTFPLLNGTSVTEVAAKHTPVVRILDYEESLFDGFYECFKPCKDEINEFLEKNFEANCLNVNSKEEMISEIGKYFGLSSDIDGYIEICNKLIQDKSYRETTGELLWYLTDTLSRKVQPQITSSFIKAIED